MTYLILYCHLFYSCFKNVSGFPWDAVIAFIAVIVAVIAFSNRQENLASYLDELKYY